MCHNKNSKSPHHPAYVMGEINVIQLYPQPTIAVFYFTGGSCRVTSMVTFGFLFQYFDRWQGLRNGTWSFYECRLSGGNIQRWWGHSNPTYCN